MSESAVLVEPVSRRTETSLAMAQTKPRAFDPDSHFQRVLQSLIDDAPWLLRITEWKSAPSPLFLIQERRSLDEGTKETSDVTELRDRGRLYGDSQRRCLPILGQILSRVQDEFHKPLELNQYMTKQGLKFRGKLPLDEEAGSKLGLIFKLQERVKELDRVELIARRVELFTEEEAAYWISRIWNFGEDANRWAISGMKVMLGGHPHEKSVGHMLDQLRTRG